MKYRQPRCWIYLLAGLMLVTVIQAQEKTSEQKVTREKKASDPQNSEDVKLAGIEAKGKRIVYLLDSSSSMAAFDAIDYAKSYVSDSIGALSHSHEFMMIHYNLIPRVIKLNQELKPSYYNATSRNRERMQEKIAPIKASSGTKIIPALKLALRQRPDVLFLISDDAGLANKERKEIKKMDQDVTKIYVLSLGQAPPPSIYGYVAPLEVLAEKNGGKYQHINLLDLKGKAP